MTAIGGVAVVMAATIMLRNNAELLSWPLRLIWLFMMIGVVMNFTASRLPNVETRWRRLYVWKGSLCLLSSIYFFISLFGLLQPNAFISMLRWVFPLWAASMSIFALMHIFEWHAAKEELQKRTEV